MSIHSRAGQRVAAGTVGVLAASLLLAGCSTSGPDKDALPAMPFRSITMPYKRAPEAKPGQHLATGDVALLPQTDYKGTPDDHIETAVIGVAEGDSSYWDRFENGDEFGSDVPFFAVIQYRWVTGDVTAYTTPLLRPILDDGSEGDIVQREYVGSLTANTACPFDVPRFDLTNHRTANEYIACVVYTAPAGSTLAGLGWYNVGDMVISEPDPEINPFYADPLVWDVTPEPLAADD